MAAFELRGTRELAARVRKDVDRLRAGVQRTHQNLVRNMLRDLVVNTPQWTGELAQHWAIEFHGHTAPSAIMRFTKESADPWEAYSEGWRPYMKGMNPAVGDTLAREFAKIPEIRYNSKVAFVNNMPYAAEVEQGLGPNGRPIRDVNLNSAYGEGIMLGYLAAKYSNKREIKKAVVKP